MPKHNNIIPNAHFHKNWQIRVKTWFNQPARQKRRRTARAEKAARIFPRPVEGSIRPIVHCPTRKYNTKVRAGRGFTVEELKAAGIARKLAPTIGIAVDLRRRNRSEQSLQENIERLKRYKSNLVLFPRNAKKVKAGEAAPSELANVTQLKGAVMPIRQRRPRGEARQITEEEKKTSVYAVLRKARSDARLVGIRKKTAAEKEANKLPGGGQ